jgi:hypothetical protein
MLLKRRRFIRSVYLPARTLVIMKDNYIRLSVFLFLFGILVSCSKKDSGNTTPTTCNFGTDVATTSSRVAVTYSASNKNSGTITSLIYQGANGEVVVTSPALPWTVTDTIPSGKQVNVTAVGTAPAGGSLYLTYAIGYTNGVISNTTGCGN